MIGNYSINWLLKGTSNYLVHLQRVKAILSHMTKIPNECLLKQSLTAQCKKGLNRRPGKQMPEKPKMVSSSVSKRLLLANKQSIDIKF